MTQDEFKPAFLGLCEIYDKTPSQYMVKLYFDAVKAMDAATWNKAVSDVISSNKYPSLPKPAEILEATGQKEDKDAQAMLAIEKIKQAIGDHGPYQSIVFDDPIIHMLISGHDMGWPGLCAGTLEEHKWLYKDWLKLYKAYMVNPIRHSNRLIGLTEGQDNDGLLTDWQKVEMVSYVGDKDKCLQLEGEQIKQIGGGAEDIVKDLTDKLQGGG